MISSDISLLRAMPPNPTLRRSTSAPMSNVMISSSKQATSNRASSRRHYQLDGLAMSDPPGRAAKPAPVGLV